MKYDLHAIEKELTNILSEKRLAHTRGVMYTAACLAMAYEIPIEKALTSGLLHDRAKVLDDETMLSCCREGDIKMSNYEMAHPFILHGKVGAYLASKEYGISDEEILNAIRFHTTGRKAMSILEKIVFIADYIEPGRKQIKDLDMIRKMAFFDLEKTMVKILETTLTYLDSIQAEIDPTTEEAYEYYKDLVGQNILR